MGKAINAKLQRRINQRMMEFATYVELILEFAGTTCFTPDHEKKLKIYFGTESPEKQKKFANKAAKTVNGFLKKRLPREFFAEETDVEIGAIKENMPVKMTFYNDIGTLVLTAIYKDGRCHIEYSYEPEITHITAAMDLEPVATEKPKATAEKPKVVVAMVSKTQKPMPDMTERTDFYNRALLRRQELVRTA